MPDTPLLKPAKLFHVEQSAFDPIPTVFPVPAETKLFHVEQFASAPAIPQIVPRGTISLPLQPARNFLSAICR
jgi:hypothetical protein